MHKETKRAYRATNKHLFEIAPQLSSARVKFECDRLENSSTSGGLHSGSEVLQTRNPIVSAAQSDKSTEQRAFSSLSKKAEEIKLASFMAQRVTQGMFQFEADKSILAQRHPSDSRLVWVSKCSLRFKATFLGWPSENL